MKHLTNFYRVPDTGLTHGLCSCGWKLTGQRDEVEARAATHDLDELAEPLPFKSKLPEDRR